MNTVKIAFTKGIAAEYRICADLREAEEYARKKGINHLEIIWKYHG